MTIAEADAAGDGGAPEGNRIQVTIRCRPFNARELASDPSNANALECSDTAVTFSPAAAGREAKTLHFDRVFGIDSSQETLFEGVGARLVDSALDAYNGCIFAYGQTGSGKSHSVVGDVCSEAGKGILPRACSRLFDALEARRVADDSFQATVLASYLEIYNEKMFDLLSSVRDSGSELQMRLHPQLGPIVVGLTECPMQSFAEALELLDFGAKRRAVGATQMNAVSSRSHAVFTVQVRMLIADGTSSVERQAKIHFVDLAGSERLNKTGATGTRLKEGIGINQSLTTLGRVIADLAKPSSKCFPPFRDSKLTLLLKDALMGNSRTELLACVSPSRFNFDETISTLEFASRCKLVKTRAKKNEQSRGDVIAQLLAEKELIEAKLQAEKAQSEELCRQLQAELEKHKAVEQQLRDRERLEEKIRELEGQHQDPQAEPQGGFEPAERERLLREKEQLEEERNLERERNREHEARLESQREELAQTQALLSEKEEILQRSPRVSEGEQQQDEGEAAAERGRECELEARLEEERRAQRAREEDLVSQIEALKGVQDSWALDQAQINAKREAQHQHREAELSKLGMHVMGVDLEDAHDAPKLVNLHPDPALKGCLVYYLPVGETTIGSDADRCRVKLTGLSIGAEMCAVSNEGNASLRVRTLDGGLVRVNGSSVSEAGQELHDGDRLAVGRAYIFQVHIPMAAKDGESAGQAELDFEHAMDEILSCAEVDPQWENGLQKAVLLVKECFGTDAAGELLRKARRASEAIAVANLILKEMPPGWTDGVAKYELSVMFDVHGLPEVCVVARRSQSPEGAGGLRGGGPSAGMWEVGHFQNDRLPAMKEALMLAKFGEDPCLWNWEARVWADISLGDYRALAQEFTLSESRSRSHAAEARRAAHPAHRTSTGGKQHFRNSPSQGWLSGAARHIGHNVRVAKDAVKDIAVGMDNWSEVSKQHQAGGGTCDANTSGSLFGLRVNLKGSALGRVVSPAALLRSTSAAGSTRGSRSTFQPRGSPTASRREKKDPAAANGASDALLAPLPPASACRNGNGVQAAGGGAHSR